MAKGNKKLNITGIILALGVAALAWFYLENVKENYELEERLIPDSSAVVFYRYIKKTRNYSGKKRWANCYVIKPYQNKQNTRVDPGCVKEWVFEAICKEARECKKNK